MKKSKEQRKVILGKLNNTETSFLKIQNLGYRSRASFKLIELNEKYNFIKKTQIFLT